MHSSLCVVVIEHTKTLNINFNRIWRDLYKYFYIYTYIYVCVLIQVICFQLAFPPIDQVLEMPNILYVCPYVTEQMKKLNYSY